MDRKKSLVLVLLCAFTVFGGQTFDTLNLTKGGHAVDGWWGYHHGMGDSCHVADTALHVPAGATPYDSAGVAQWAHTALHADTADSSKKYDNRYLGLHGKADSTKKADTSLHYDNRYSPSFSLTQYYLPAVNAGGTTLGNSLIQQNSAGTIVSVGTAQTWGTLNISSSSVIPLALHSSGTINILEFYNPAGTVEALWGLSNSTSGIVAGTVANDLGFRTQGGSMLFSTNSGTGAALKINSAGYLIPYYGIDGSTFVSPAAALTIIGSTPDVPGGYNSSKMFTAWNSAKTECYRIMWNNAVSPSVISMYTDYQGAGVEIPFVMGTYSNASNQLKLNVDGTVSLGHYATAGILQNNVTTGLVSSHAAGAGKVQIGSGGQLADGNMTEASNVLTLTDSIFANGYGIYTTHGVKALTISNLDTTVFAKGIKTTLISFPGTNEDNYIHANGNYLELKGHSGLMFPNLNSNKFLRTGLTGIVYDGPLSTDGNDVFNKGDFKDTGNILITGNYKLKLTDDNAYINATSSGNMVISGSTIGLCFGTAHIIDVGYGGTGIIFPLLSTGIIHANSVGLLTSSLLVASDVTNNTLTNTQLANLVAVGTIPMGATYGLTASAITQAGGKVTIGNTNNSYFLGKCCRKKRVPISKLSLENTLAWLLIIKSVPSN